MCTAGHAVISSFTQLYAIWLYTQPCSISLTKKATSRKIRDKTQDVPSTSKSFDDMSPCSPTDLHPCIIRHSFWQISAAANKPTRHAVSCPSDGTYTKLDYKCDKQSTVVGQPLPWRNLCMSLWCWDKIYTESTFIFLRYPNVLQNGKG